MLYFLFLFGIFSCLLGLIRTCKLFIWFCKSSHLHCFSLNEYHRIPTYTIIRTPSLIGTQDYIMQIVTLHFSLFALSREYEYEYEFEYNNRTSQKRWLFVYLAKGQLISKAHFEVFIWTKNQRKYFCISALASKMGLIIKIMADYHAYYKIFSIDFLFIWKRQNVLSRLTDL